MEPTCWEWQWEGTPYGTLDWMRGGRRERGEGNNGGEKGEHGGERGGRVEGQGLTIEDPFQHAVVMGKRGSCSRGFPAWEP